MNDSLDEIGHEIHTLFTLRTNVIAASKLLSATMYWRRQMLLASAGAEAMHIVASRKRTKGQRILLLSKGHYYFRGEGGSRVANAVNYAFMSGSTVFHIMFVESSIL